MERSQYSMEQQVLEVSSQGISTEVLVNGNKSTYQVRVLLLVSTVRK